MSRIFLSAFLCIFCLSLQGATLFNTPPFYCEMSLADEATSPTELVFSVTSKLDKDMRLLSWYTPLEGLMSDLFIITNGSGEVLPYQGMMVKRGQPTEEDWLSIAAGKSIEVVLELRDAYPFDTGEYQINLKPQEWEYRISTHGVGSEGDDNRGIDGEVLKGECGMGTVTVHL